MPPEQQTPPFRVRWNQVTWYSKLGAIILFLGVIPALCFYIGMQYGEVVLMSADPAPVTVIKPHTSIATDIAESNACWSAGNRLDIDECFAKADVAAEAAMDTVFTTLLAAAEKFDSEMGQEPLDVKQKKAIESSQQAWLSFREEECRAHANVLSGGTGQSAVYMSCRLDKLAERMKELSAYATEVGAGD